MPHEHPIALTASALRWVCDPDELGFDSTEQVTPVQSIVGQELASEALQFGLALQAQGQHIFVRGQPGTGRLTLVRELMDKVAPTWKPSCDRVYVHSFAEPNQPRLLTLPRAKGPLLRDYLDSFICYIRESLHLVIDSENLKTAIRKVERQTEAAVEAVTRPFQNQLADASLALMAMQTASATRPVLVPVIDDEPAPPEKLEQLVKDGKLSDADLEAIREKTTAYSDQLQEITQKVQKIQIERNNRARQLLHQEAELHLTDALFEVREAFADHPDVLCWLKAVQVDVIAHHVPTINDEYPPERRYRANVILTRAADDTSVPKIIETAPTVHGLLGTVQFSPSANGQPKADHLSIQAGSLLRADGGYLVLDARDVVTEPGAWQAIVRTLRSGRIDYAPPTAPSPWQVTSLNPEPIPVTVQVILIGDAKLYHLLDHVDSDFPQLFKILVDFDHTIPVKGGLQVYAGVIAHLVETNKLIPFESCSLAALAEHGARIAARQTRLSARFGRIADIAREAAFVATKRGATSVFGDDVREAVRRSKARANMPGKKFLDAVKRGVISIATSGTVVGQVNGLAVMSAGPLTYGFPSRITGAAAPGTAGAINIERESELSGSIHTKGFFILGGLLRRLLKTEHPLSFDISLAFEQSYGGIDGDSASGAEMCCLLSALTEIPIHQGIAMTGAIDQLGNVLPVGAVNEKIEGFFDVCSLSPLTGEQGVILPKANAGDLMLRHDVVAACRAGRFHVWPVSRIEQALTLLTGQPAGTLDANNTYAPGSVLGAAVEQAHRYWEQSGNCKR